MQQNHPRSASRSPNAPSPLLRRRALPALGVLPALLLALLMLGGQPLAVAPAHATRPVSTAAGPTAITVGTPQMSSMGRHIQTGSIPLSEAYGVASALLPGLSPSAPSLSRLGSSPHGDAPAARPAASSTASNFVAANITDPSSIVSVGGSNSTLVLASESYDDLDNGSISLLDGLTASPYFFKYGFSTIYRSTDSGTTWGTTWVPRNASWSTSGSYTDGTVGLGVNQVVSAGTGGATGAKLFGVESFEPSCIADSVFPAEYGAGTPATGAANCTAPENASGPMGIAVTESTDGGQSWGAARPLVYADPWPWKVLPTVGACTGGLTWFPDGNYTDNPQIAYSAGSNVVLVTWMNASFDLSNFTCMNVNGQNQFFATFGFTTSMWESVSTNGGASFSAPAEVTRAVALNPFSPITHALEAYSSIAIGPGPTYPIYRVELDVNNSTTSTIPFAFSSSTDNGTSFSAWSDIGNVPVYPVLTSAPGSFVNDSVPYLAVDNWTGSPYKGDLYLVWNDNVTAAPGTPSIAFSRSTDGGTTWSDAVYLSPSDSATNSRYFQPSAAVAPNGALWVQYYGESLTTTNNGAGLITGSYDTYGTYSTNSGGAWTPQFRIDDTTSSFQASGSSFNMPALYGPAIVGTTAGAYAVWSDCRGGLSCPGLSGLAFQQSAFVANLHSVGLSSNAPGVNATLTTFGPSTTVALPGTAVLETGATVGVQVPAWVPDTTTMIYAFQNYSGFASSNLNPAALTYSGSGSLSANYLPEPAGWIAGTVGPIGAGLVVTVNGASVPLSPFNSTADQYNATIAAGVSYVVTAIRAGYTPFSQSVPTQAGMVSSVNIWLPRESGWISGKLTPPNATLMVNSTVVAVNPNGGAFNQTVTWGQYWVNASESGYTSFSQLVTVSPEKTFAINPTLVGGWITGSINPLSGAVQVNGVPVTLQAGNFNVSEPGGTYDLTARAPGYSWFHWTVSVTPGHAVTKNIRLTNQGYIVGTVGPANAIASAIVLVAGSQVRLNSSGGFNASEGPGSHTVSASATNYNQNSTTVTVVAGNVTWANITLTASNPHQPCTVTNTCPPGNNSTGTTSNSNLLLYAGIGAAIVLVAIIAGVLLMRRRPPAQDADTGSSPPAAYDESAESGGTPPST